MIGSFRKWLFCLVAAILLLRPHIGWAQEHQASSNTADALHAALIDRHASMFAEGAPDPLFDFYRSRNFAPAWTGTESDAAAAAAVLAVLSRADAQGLRPQDYAGTAKAWRAAPEPGPQAAAFELSLMTDLMRYAADVRLGKTNPTRVYQDVELPARTFEFVAALSHALQAGRIEQFLADLPPQQAEYRGLVQGLANYRAQQGAGGWAKISGKGEVALDDGSERSRALTLRLSQEDPLLAEAPNASIDDVRNALMRFQARNGLRADGRAGEQTVAALNVPIRTRIAQIAINLERWRWMQRTFEDKYVLVNVPDQTAKVIANGEVLLETRAIVGRLGSKTPITRMMANSLVLNPPWHVPEDIATEQILPKLRQDPNYLVSRNMVLADGPPGDPHGLTIDWRSMKTMPYLVDQKPGPDSAMGNLMIDSPNDFGVYLHDTPGKGLFQADARQESNGCIRVEDMLGLSALVFGGEKESIVEQLRADIATGQTQRVALQKQVPIYLLYQTAIPYTDGSVGFRKDPYGRDRPLFAALSASN